MFFFLLSFLERRFTKKTQLKSNVKINKNAGEKLKHFCSQENFKFFQCFKMINGFITLVVRIVCQSLSSVRICCSVSSFESVPLITSTADWLRSFKLISFCFKLNAYGMFDFWKFLFQKNLVFWALSTLSYFCHCLVLFLAWSLYLLLIST